jgi:probable phosphoglycerate mutase
MMPDDAADLPWEPIARRGHVPLLLVRHGETDWNAQHRFLGRSDISLNDTGHHQIASLSGFLSRVPLSAAFSSPLRRATQTAMAIIADRSLSLSLDPRLAELDQGHLEGRTFSEVRGAHAGFFAAWTADPASCRVPGGESFPECQARGMAALTEIARQSRPGPPVLVVTHSMVIRAIICEIRGLPLARFRDINQDNAAVNLLSCGDGGFRVHALNLRPSSASPGPDPG